MLVLSSGLPWAEEDGKGFSLVSLLLVVAAADVVAVSIFDLRGCFCVSRN
jgi:hypothetical protein